jgi:hypothetical protein
MSGSTILIYIYHLCALDVVASGINDIIGPVEGVSYTPFQIEARRPAQALLPSTFPIQPHSYDYRRNWFIDMFHL